MAKKHMKRCPASLIMKEMENKTTMRYHFIPIKMDALKNRENNKCQQGHKEQEPINTVNGKVKWCSPHGKQYGSCSKKKKKNQTESLHHLAIWQFHFWVHPKELKTGTWKDSQGCLQRWRYSWSKTAAKTTDGEGGGSAPPGREGPQGVRPSGLTWPTLEHNPGHKAAGRWRLGFLSCRDYRQAPPHLTSGYNLNSYVFTINVDRLLLPKSIKSI